MFYSVGKLTSVRVHCNLVDYAKGVLNKPLNREYFNEVLKWTPLNPRGRSALCTSRTLRVESAPEISTT